MILYSIKVKVHVFIIQMAVACMLGCWCIYMKKFFMGVFIVALLIATFATLPRVDYIEPNVLFYLHHLTPLYYVCVFAAIAMAIYYRRNFLGLLSVIVLGLLILWTPSIMLVQPWFLDTYPFAAEAVYVVRNGYIGKLNHLSASPALGLTFGPFLMITGISPFMLQKIYPGLFAIIFAVLLYVTAKKMKIGNEASVVAPLLFISIAWPNELHFCRQSFSLIFYLTSWFLLLHLVFRKSDRRIFMLLVAQVFALTMSHPATPLFFVFNVATMATVAFLDQMWQKIRRKARARAVVIRACTQILLISASAWIFWNAFNPATRALRDLTGIINNLVASLARNPSEVSGVTTIFANYSPIYGLAINIRFALTLAVFVSAILLPFVIYRYVQDRKLMVILTGWVISNMFTSVPLLYAGLGYFARPALFTFISWATSGALVYSVLASKSEMYIKIKSLAKYVFLLVFIIVPLFFIPIIKYGPIPFLYPTSRELVHKEFLDLHWVSGRRLVYLEFNLPYGYSYILHGIKELPRSTIYRHSEGLDSVLTSRKSLWITYRLCTRDAFRNYTPSMLYVVENLTLYQTTYNKIYDSGWPESILIPMPNSTK